MWICWCVDRWKEKEISLESGASQRITSQRRAKGNSLRSKNLHVILYRGTVSLLDMTMICYMHIFTNFFFSGLKKNKKSFTVLTVLYCISPGFISFHSTKCQQQLPKKCDNLKYPHFALEKTYFVGLDVTAGE